jgi:oligopeptide/dipeptide ABC transporter ATP-binding protein
VAERLIVDGLSVTFGDNRRAVRDVSFEVAPGQAFGLVGESGSGKSLTCRAILGLLPGRARSSGRILYGQRSLLELDAPAMQRLRGSTIGMVFQDPMTALNPVLRVSDAIAQVVASHERIGGRAARARAVHLMQRVGIRDAERLARAFPHQFSGGMRQRIVIAMALAARPTLLLADEPTTALDVVVQAGILRLLDRLRREDGMSLLLVSHDFGVIANLCDRVGVMYAGELVEVGPRQRILFWPHHPYTIGLIESLPEIGRDQRLRSIAGQPPEPDRLPTGCAFAPRCPIAADPCRVAPIDLLPVIPDHAARCIRWDETAPLRAGLDVRRSTHYAPALPEVAADA